MFSHKLSIPSSNTLSNANAPITIVTANVEVRRNKALYTVLPTLILALESSRNPGYEFTITGFSSQDGGCVSLRCKGRWSNYQVAKSDGICTSSSRQVYCFPRFTSSSRYFYAVHVFKNFLATRNRMSTMLSNVSLDHDEGMAVQEATTFRFSEEPSLEKM